MVYYFTPFYDKDLGEAYNRYCELVPNDDDWITLMDGDVMQLNMNWGQIWEKILEKNDDAGIVTCLTNRISTPCQLAPKMFAVENILAHRLMAKRLFSMHGYTTEKINEKICGFYFSFKKKTWKKVGKFINSILAIDYDFSQRVLDFGLDIRVAKGFYVFHYWRFLEDPKKGVNFKYHLKN
jgi:GT2 family glycosyltransferase